MFWVEVWGIAYNSMTSMFVWRRSTQLALAPRLVLAWTERTLWSFTLSQHMAIPKTNFCYTFGQFRRPFTLCTSEIPLYIVSFKVAL